LSYSQYEDALDLEGVAWTPTKDETQPRKIIGQVVDLDERDSEYGDPYQVISLQTEDETVWSVHCFHTTSRNAVKRLAPQVGDVIGVKYVGVGEAKKGQNAPHIFRFKVFERGSFGAATEQATINRVAGTQAQALAQQAAAAAEEPAAPAVTAQDDGF
jgi:hypothetical protein